MQNDIIVDDGVGTQYGMPPVEPTPGVILIVTILIILLFYFL